LVLLLVGVGLWVGDQALRYREMDQWISVMEDSEETMQDYLADEKRAYDDWSRTTNNGSNSTDASITEWLRVVSEAAEDRATELKVHEYAISQIGFAPWHGSIAAARDAYLDHMRVWIENLDDMAQVDTLDEASAADARYGSDIRATFKIAHEVAKDALPTLFASDLKKRIETEFAS
jgi:hypothetical protein